MTSDTASEYVLLRPATEHPIYPTDEEARKFGLDALAALDAVGVRPGGSALVVKNGAA